jgi:heat shock protein HslJ
MLGWLRKLLGTSSDDRSLQGSWQITSYLGASELTTPVEGTAPSIAIEGERMSGTTGLNRIGGHFNGSFPLDPLAVTRMSGPPDLMEQENAILGLLQTVDGYRLEDDELSLERSGETVIELNRHGTASA